MPPNKMTEFVIDTVGFRCNWPIECLDPLEWNIERVYNERVLQSDNEQWSGLFKVRAYHKALGIRASGDGSRITYVQVSIARVLHGDNGNLIKSQTEVDEALNAVKGCFDGFAITTNGIVSFLRVDIGLHFQCNPVEIIRAHRHCRYPRTRRPRTDFGEHSAAWAYDGRRIIMYDKGREMTRRYMQNEGLASGLLRVEIQLSKGPLKRALGYDNYPTELDFVRCYHAFREMMLNFAPAMEIAAPTNIYSAIATLEQSGMVVGGQTPLEMMTSGMEPRTAREWRRRVSQSAVQMVGFDWAQILPEDGPPELIDWEPPNLNE